MPQPQINPGSAVAQCWEGSSSSFPVVSAALQRSSSSIPGQSLIQPWLQGCVQDSRNQAATISCAGKHAACAAQTAPDGYCLDTGSTLALPPLTRCYWAYVARVCKMSLVKKSIFFGTAFPYLKKKPKQTTTQRQKVAFVCIPVHWTWILCRGREHLSANETQTSKRKQNTFYFSWTEKKKDWLCTKLKIYTKFLVVTTVTKPKSHLAAERKHRNDLWLIQFQLCWVFRPVPILARLQLKLWCSMDWLQVTPVIQHAFWKVWLTFPSLGTQIHCKKRLVLHMLWNTALENVSSAPCDFMVWGRAHWQHSCNYIFIHIQNKAMKNWLWWIYVLQWL